MAPKAQKSATYATLFRPNRGRIGAALIAFVLIVIVSPGVWAQNSSRYAAIVIDAATGEVFHQHNADRQLYPASLTKMMTLYMTFRALDEGRLTLNQQIPVSRHADSQPPSHLALSAGSTIRVEDAIYALVTKSANDVAAVLAEALGGTESEFAEMMTRQARELGMSRTTFRNASGLPDNGQKSTARDMARLAQALIWNFPEQYAYFRTRNWQYRGVAYRNHNRLLGTYDGMDGLKTGYIRASGFNLAASAVRGNLRLIAVMFGGDTADQRNRRVAALLDQAFDTARGRQLIAGGTVPFNAPPPPRSPALGPLPDLPEVAMATTPPPLWAAAMPLPPRRPGGTVVVANTALEEEGSADSSAMPRSGRVATLLSPTDGGSGPLPIVPVPPSRTETTGAGGDIADDPIGQLAATVAGTGSAPPPAPVAGWAIQVGAYPERAASESATRAATERLPDLLGRAQPRVIPVNTDAGTLYRARLVGLDATTASAACASLTAVGTSCVTIAPGL